MLQQGQGAGDLGVGDTGGSPVPGVHHFQTLTRTFSPELSTQVSLVFEVSPASLPSPVNDYPGWRLPKSHQDSNTAGMTSPSKHWLCWPGQGAKSQQLLHSFLLTQKPRCVGPPHCQLVVCCRGTDQNHRRPQPPLLPLQNQDLIATVGQL